MSKYQQKLNELFGTESTSAIPSDPVKEDSSGLGIVGGLGVLGATGVGLYALAKRRLPGAKIAEEIFNKKVPELPVSRTTELTNDKVADILDVVPTKMQRATEVAPSQYQQFIDQFKQIRDVSKTKPLTVGGKKERFGSALYDYLAQHPANKPLPADQWIKEFSNFNRLSSYEIPIQGTKIRASITKEELFDTNIAQFDKEGKVIGGFLRLAQENNLPISKLDLMQMVEKSPAVNTVIRRFKYQNPEKLKIDTAGYIDEEVRIYDDASKKINEYYAGLPSKEKTRTESSIVKIQKAIMDLKAESRGVKARVENALESGLTSERLAKDYFTSIKETGKSNVGIGQLNQFIRNELSISPDKFVSPETLTTLANKGRSISRNIQSQINQGLTPRYGEQYSYRILGAEDYYEDVAYIKKIPFDKDVKPGALSAGKHYEEVAGEIFKNQIYHARYGKRSLEGNPNKKVFAIDEIQSDIQAVAFPADPTRSKVINPFNSEQEFNQANVALNNLKDKMKAIASKGAAITENDKFEFRRLSSNFEELRKKTMNASNIAKIEERYGRNADIPYLPFFDRSSYGDHALKQTLKTAAENNVEWVVVNPVERLHALRNLGPSGDKPFFGKLGDWEFYGDASGKAGRLGVSAKSDRAGEVKNTNPKQFAIIPDRMRDLARQYNSEAKTINVSLSDPNKPFKIIEKLNLDEKSAKALGVPKQLQQQHTAAFKTEEEAVAWQAITGQRGSLIKMEANDPNLYYPAFGIKVTDTMKGTPFKLYKKEGGLVVNIFA
jgi:hypothetical protein